MTTGVGPASAEPAVRDQANTYTAPARPALNAWGLAGQWTVGAERATFQLVLVFYIAASQP